MNLQKVFIANLKKYRKAGGFSQALLAEYCNLSANYIGQIEMGRRIPSFEKIEKIAAALRIEPHILFQEERGEIPEKKPSASTRDLLAEMHPKIRRELCRRLLREIRKGVNSSFNPENY